MPSTHPIYVDKTLFLGRVEEQKQFRAALKEVLGSPSDEDLPYILLLFGDGGMGKTTLAKRLRDIAQLEQPFESSFQILWADWEDERRRYPSLQAGREYIAPETVFEIIHAKAIDQKWGGYFGTYQESVKKRGEVEKQAAQILSAVGEQDDLAALRGAGATAIAKVLRLGLPIGETGEKLARAFLDVGIRVGAEQAAHLRAAVENRLRARLDPKQFDLFLNPNEQLARALGEGLRKTSESKPLIVFLDTYEIVDRADLWVRSAIRTAGPRIVWIISGRDNLMRSGQFGSQYFKGYAEEFPRRLLGFDMRQLAEQDTRALLTDRASDRELDERAVQAISRATRGVPLALNEAAEMWAKGVALVDIVGDIDDATPRGQIVQKMTARYLLHAVAEADKQAIFALALAHGNIEILRAMLRPAGGGPFDLDSLLRQLERDYASVHYESARLHDEPAFFLQNYLKEEIHRTEDRVRTLNQRAVEALRERLQKLETDLPLLEDRCKDDDWLNTALDLAEHLFWLDENETWHWLVPRLVESLAYSGELRRGLVQIAIRWQDYLSKTGKKRVKVLRAADHFFLPDEQGELLEELTRLERMGWLKGEGESERGAILNWRDGQLFYVRAKYTDALAQYDRAERGLPKNGEALKKQLGEAMNSLAIKFIWPESMTGSFYSTEAERILLKVVAWLPENEVAWYQLGVTLSHGGKLPDALVAYQRAIELDPKNALPHNGLGNLYRVMGKFADALAAYEQAIEIDPKFALPHNGLGIVYRELGKFDDALAAYEQAIEIDPKFALAHASLASCYRKLGRENEAKEHIKIARLSIARETLYNRACFESICGNVDSALALLKAQIDIAPIYRKLARRDPDFDFIRANPRFSALVGE